MIHNKHLKDVVVMYWKQIDQDFIDRAV